MPSQKKSCACAVQHHGGFVHGPATEDGGRYCFDCFVIKECHLKPYQGPPCHQRDGSERCSMLQGHAGPHAYQGSLL